METIYASCMQIFPKVQHLPPNAIEFRKKKVTLSKAQDAQLSAIFLGSDRAILFTNFNRAKVAPSDGDTRNAFRNRIMGAINRGAAKALRKMN